MLALAATSGLNVLTSCSVQKSADELPLPGAVAKELEMPDGSTIRYRAYEHLYYVTNVEDSAYQYLNLYIPESVYESGGADVPIFFRTYVGGYRAAKAKEPSGLDASGRALQEGYVVCIPGSRGNDSAVEDDGKKVYTGRVPAGLLDLKAAIRYLRANDARLPGNAERIITDGTSAGGAMSSLLGATGNSPLYEPYLEKMGAADARDDVFAAVCYCPITDLDHADMAYEWLYQYADPTVRPLTGEQQEIAQELAQAYPEYLNSLQLKTADGTLLTADNYLDYLKTFLIRSAQKARDEGCTIPDGIGVILNVVKRGGPHGPQGAQQGQPGAQRPQGPQNFAPQEQGDFVLDIDLPAYLSYVATTRELKTPPSFDAMGVLTDAASPENQVFGDADGGSANFTAYSLRKATGNPTAEPDEVLRRRIYLMNPMNFIADQGSTKAPHWFIRHGARDRDTAFPVPLNLATKLMNNGYDVDFFLPWNRPHSGDYNLDELFAWVKRVTAAP
ncbi:MAG: subtype B tannase [Bacteroides sp.]|nr:subtype B tannase [Bacteroides sp.]